ncbi:hypothetical protein K445DRAFT_216226 [Daldinia sp. EC12]|nr:hypothetical protein K445DRAFT_216226 [Daldinia sp. EC12]
MVRYALIKQLDTLLFLSRIDRTGWVPALFRFRKQPRSAVLNGKWLIMLVKIVLSSMYPGLPVMYVPCMSAALQVCRWCGC